MCCSALRLIWGRISNAGAQLISLSCGCRSHNLFGPGRDKREQVNAGGLFRAVVDAYKDNWWSLSSLHRIMPYVSLQPVGGNVALWIAWRQLGRSERRTTENDLHQSAIKVLSINILPDWVGWQHQQSKGSPYASMYVQHVTTPFQHPLSPS